MLIRDAQFANYIWEIIAVGKKSNTFSGNVIGRLAFINIDGRRVAVKYRSDKCEETGRNSGWTTLELR